MTTGGNPQRDSRRGFLYALAGAILLSTNFVTAKYTLEGFNPAAFALIWASAEGLDGFQANHVGGVFGVDPHGEVIVRSNKTSLEVEIRTCEITPDRFRDEHKPGLARRPAVTKSIIDAAVNRQLAHSAAGT